MLHASRHRRDIHAPVLSCVRMCGTTLTVHKHILAHIYVHDLRDSANVPINVSVFSKVPPCALQRDRSHCHLVSCTSSSFPDSLCVLQYISPPQALRVNCVRQKLPPSGLSERPVSWLLYLVPGTWLLEAKPRLPWESRTRHQMGKKTATHWLL